MKLYFLRHAEALPGEDDEARPLSQTGKKEALSLGRFLKHAGIAFDAAFSSPLVRARQTAEIVLKISGDVSPAELSLTEALQIETSQKTFERWLKDLPEAKKVLLVGHEPTLSERVRRLLTIASAERLNLPKGGLVCVDSEDRRTGCLKFFVSPKILVD
ncbi:MAG: phosphohistidine phosphatase SixA [Verrucomicrobiota bacterium]